MIPISWKLLRIYSGIALACAACHANDDPIFTLDSPALQAGVGHAAGQTAGMSGSGPAGSAANQAVAGAGGSIAAAGSTHLDPNVTFRWTETTPGRGSCAGQTFVGIFKCDVSPVLLSPSVEGALMLTFGGTQENQPLSLTDGQLFAFDDSNVQFLTAPLTGKLDCGTRIVTLDVTQSPTEVLQLTRQIAWVLPSSQPMVNGTLHGNFDSSALTIAGDVMLAFADTQTKCLGTFTVQAAR